MALLSTYADDEYLPEFGTLMVRDHWDQGVVVVPQPDGEPPREYPQDTQPTGTLTRSGDGWLEGSAGDGYLIVRLEAHSSEPPDDRLEWTDVAETPYYSGVGAVGLTYVTGGTVARSLELGGPGRYAVRVSRRAARADELADPDVADPGDLWRLQFWPDRCAALPRWLRRGRPATRAGDPGWSSLLRGNAMELGWVASAATPEGQPGATEAEMERWGLDHRRPPSWLDRPLWTAPPPALTTGHPDLDAAAEQRQRESRAYVEREAAALAAVAAQLGVPAPTSARETLPLLVAAGILAIDDSSGTRRYRPGQPKRAQDVLDLPPDEVRRLDLQDSRARYTSFAADLVSTVVWATAVPVTTTVDALADRVLASTAEVRATLEYAASRALLTVGGDLSAAGAPLSLSLPAPAPATSPSWGTPAPRSAAPPQPAAPTRPWPTAAPTGGGNLAVTLFAARRGDHSPPGPQPPLGPPPRAGVVTGTGDLIVWRDDEPVVVATGTGQPAYKALRSRFGVVMAGPQGITHIPDDGRGEHLDDVPVWHAAISPDGRRLAYTEIRTGRRPRNRIHLIDLADGSRYTMPWDESDFLTVVTVDVAAVYAGTTAGDVLRWVPGAEPVSASHLVRQIDPLTGTILARSREPGVLVVRPDGTEVHLAVSQEVQLAPGGSRLYLLRHEPPALTLFDVTTGPTRPTVYPLPGRRAPNESMPGQLVWESERDLVAIVGPANAFPEPAIRIDTGTGAVHRVPLAPNCGYRPMLVSPLL